MFFYFMLCDPCLTVWNIWPWKLVHDLENVGKRKNHVFSVTTPFLKISSSDFGMMWPRQIPLGSVLSVFLYLVTFDLYN